MNINHLTIAGNLTAPPELKFLPDGKAVCNMRIANNLKLNNGNNKTTFIDCVAWEKTAEVCEKYLVKGSPVLFEGRLDLEEWENKEGQKRSKHVLTVNRLHLFPADRPAALQGGDGGGSAAGGGDGAKAGQAPDNPFA